ncbi:MAG: exodeoxyribonuclease VII large subunit [Thermoleophilia bacterium]|nr:exodeoxyribonuclease VII large subunit [Thermoleophilia bacterium]
METSAVEAVAESPSAIWRRVEGALEEVGGGVVEAEVQKCFRAASGHVYLDLTDGEALVKCVIWKSNADRIAELPQEGQLVQARYTKVRVYAKNGSVSLDVNAIRGAGEGELLARVQETLARLVADGLTDPERKLPIPRFPRRVGLVTGRGSDAEADVLRALRDRFPPTRIAVSYSLVQGVNAVPELIDALARLDIEPDVEVIILARGGGSVEDLLPFSDERLCRAIAALGTPVVTSIGHTKQRPNCDHVASAAAEVPARAAEHVVPSAAELDERIDRRAAEIAGFAWGRLVTAEAQIDRSAMRPAGQAALIPRVGRVELAGQSLSHAIAVTVTRPRERISGCATTLARTLQSVPRPASLDAVRERLGRATGELRHRVQLGSTALSGALNLVRARDWRERGFALVRLPTGALVSSTQDLAAGQPVIIQLKGGLLDATIEHVHPDETETDA